MKISILEGHLTPQDKKVVKYMLDNKMKAGKVGKKHFTIIPFSGNTYQLLIKVKDRGLIPCAGSQLRISFYKHKFQVN
jgi:hypothetical protein